MFTVAMRLEEAETNPCQSVERFALDNQRVRYLTEDEETRLFERYSHAMHERKAQALDKLAVASNLRQMQNGRGGVPAVSV